MEANEEHPAVNNLKIQETNDILRYEERLEDVSFSAQSLQKFMDDLCDQFTSLQRNVFDEVVMAVDKKQGGCFFVESGRTRMKLDLLNAILASVRIEEDRVEEIFALATSSQQLASRLLLFGQTFHSAFYANIDVTNDPILQIEKGSVTANPIRLAKVIVVDQAVCLNKLYIEALDEKIKEITNSKKVFGGKVIVLAGDFRQLLPVGQGDRCELVINRSRLWSEFKVFTLRAQEEDISEFDKWLQQLGNGDKPLVNAPDLNHRDYIELEEDMCIQFQEQTRDASLSALIQFVFPSFAENIHTCAIMTPTKDYVQEINDACMQRLPDPIRICLGTDKTTGCTCHSEPSHPCPCSLKMFDSPSDRLDLKIGAPLILLVTLYTEELSTGTRLTLNNIGEKHLKCTVPGGRVVKIPKMWLRTAKSWNGQWDGKVRNQFPVLVAFATTIHKIQGLMLKRAGVWLEKDVFTHGQLYAAASCVARREDIRFVLPKRGVPSCYATRNIVNKEVFLPPVTAPRM